MVDTNQHDNIKDDIRDALESGSDIHEKVKAITFKALTEQQLDTENIKNVVEAVSEDISEGMMTQSE